MRIVKRAGCLGLAVTCTFFTGCNSIIYNGDFRFKSFEPETVPAVQEAVTDKVDETVTENDTGKYNVEGTDAFYILPNHENDPEKILDFRVLDYTDAGRFVYAYLTPYYGTASDGLDGAGKTGTAPEENRYEDYSGRTSGSNVLVLMSYDPETRAYTVFYSAVTAASAAETSVNRQAEEDVGSLTASATNSTVMANRLVKEHRYFIFDDYTAWLYDADGNELMHHSYSTVITQEAERLKAEALEQGAESKQVKGATVSVSDVVMDGYYYVYIPLTVELATADGEEADYESDALEKTVYTTVISCYDLDIGGSQGVTFYSANNAWEEQKKYWSELHLDTDAAKKLVDGSGIFEDEDAVEEYQELYSMDAVKQDYVPDSYAPFHTEGNSMNMELAGVPSIFSFTLWRINRQDNSFREYRKYSFSELLQEVIRHPEKFGSDLCNAAESVAQYCRVLDIRSSFWSLIHEAWREKIARFSMDALALLSQDYYDGTASRDYYDMIPWLCPGAWDGTANAQPLERDSSRDLEAVFAYKTSVYSVSGGYRQVSRYVPLSFKNRYSSVSGAPELRMQVAASSAEGEAERTFRYWSEDENGEEYVEEVTETLGSYPVKYSLNLPESAAVTWLESSDTSEMVAASGGLGVVYYSEVSGGDYGEQAYSCIRYNEGNQSDSLSLSNVKGRAMDAGVLYYEGSETTVLVTDEGLQFCRRGDGGYASGTRQWVPMEDLEQAASGYGLSRYNQETQTSSGTDSRLSVSEDSDRIIRKNSESGVAADTYIAANMSLLNERDVVVSSLSGGIILVNTDNGLTICLKNGAYFAAYPYTTDGGRRFMIAGYDTQQYAYQPGDIARAKCYSVDLEAENARLENEAVQQHLKGLANDYLNRTHRLTRGDDGTWSIVTPTADEQTANRRAERLFFGTEAEAEAELSAVAGELGISSVSEATKSYARSLREQMTAQRAAVQEFYRLAGLGVQTVPAQETWLLEYEGQLISAMNGSALEDFLVELRLSDAAVGRIADAQEKERYTEYQEEMRAAVLTNSTGSASVPQEGSSQTAESQYAGLRQEYEKGSAQRRAAIEASAFYTPVLEDAKNAYLAGAGEGADWDTYLADLLKRISPDNAVTQQERGLAEFCGLTGIAEDIARSQNFPERIAQFRRVRELEELIVEYRLNTAEYRGSSMKAEFAAYQEALYETAADKTAAFRAGSFYRIIEELKAADEKLLEGTDWDQKLREVLGMCTQGIVLMDD